MTRIEVEPYLEAYGRLKQANVKLLAEKALADSMTLVPSMADDIRVMTGFMLPFSRFLPESNSILTFLPPLCLNPYYGIEARDASVVYSLTHEFTEPMVFKPGKWELLKNAVSEVVLPSFEMGSLLDDETIPSLDDVYLHSKAVVRDVIIDRMIVNSVQSGAEGFIIFQNQQYGKTRHFINSLQIDNTPSFEQAYDIVSNFLSCSRRAIIAAEIKDHCTVKDEHRMYLSRYGVQSHNWFICKVLGPLGCKDSALSVLQELKKDLPDHKKIYSYCVSMMGIISHN